MNQTAHKIKRVNRTKTMRFHPFVFTGKERDEETGYGYFGARYMDHELMTMWLSVDPIADKYPSISPYAYCAWNPVKLVDPDGREMTDFKDAKGNVVKHIDDNQDVVYQEVGNGYFRHYEYQSGEINSFNIDYQTTLVAQEQQQLNTDNSKLEQNPKTKDTYCNFATQNILNAVGSIPGNNNAKVSGMVANQMVDWFGNNSNFVEVSQSDAAAFADAGYVSVVGAKAKSHGHVATLTIGANRSSSQQYANVGLKNGFMNFSDIFSNNYQRTHDIKHFVYLRGYVLPTVTITAPKPQQ